MSSTQPPPPPVASPAPAPAQPAAEGATLTEIIAGIVLGIAATIAAFAAFQGALAGGASLEGYTVSTQHLSDANFFYNASAQQFIGDQQLFLAFATAANTPGQEGVAEYIQDQLMNDNLGSAVEWWQGDDDAATPFDDAPGNPYEDPSGEAAEAEQLAAEETFAEGVRQNQIGDRYELAGVILAITLFFAGLSTLMRSRKVAWALLVVSIVTLGVGSVLVLTNYLGAVT
ncbi:hypothetical protein BH23ACT9_BH23ACT9_25770 [soil metagenome]